MSVSLPLYIFNFVDFEDLDRRARHGDGLVDVIGQLTVVHPIVHSSTLNGTSVRREVELRDLSDQPISITLWGEHATSFEDEFLIKTVGKDEPVVIIFAGMQVKLFLGAPRCRSDAATKWYINIDIPEVNALRASLEGRGSEVVFLPGDNDAATGVVNEENANWRTVSELLSLNPHKNNDVRFTCHANIKEIDVTNGWWYKGCSICKRSLKPTLQGFECINCNETEPLQAKCGDATGRAKIFMFGGVAEQVVPRTAAELVEESSTNQILLPATLRSLVGRSYVFQVVISEQTFRTGQLCFQARRVFAPPAAAGTQRSGAHGTTDCNPGALSSAGNSVSEKAPTVIAGIRTSNDITDKDSMDNASSATEISIPSQGESTPPPDTRISAGKNSATKGKEVPSGAHEEHGNVLGKRSRSTRKELFSSKKEKASDE